MAEGGSGMPGTRSEDPDVMLSECPPSSAAEVALSDIDSATPASLVKDEVKQELDGPGDALPGTGTQSGT